MVRYKEIRLQVVNEVIENGLSENEAARKYGMNHDTVNQWVAAYINNGEHGVADKNTKRSFSGEQKMFILEDIHRNQMSFKRTSKKHGVADSVIRKWNKQYLTGDIEGLYTERRGRKGKGDPPVQTVTSNANAVEDMEQENKRLRMEVDYLKKLQALVQEKRRSRMGKRL